MFAKKNFRCVVMIFVTLFMFAACKTNVEESTSIYGKWKSSYGEVFVIGDTTFENYYGETLSYAGDNITIEKKDDSSGYIYMKYTNNAYSSDVVGKWYAVYYSGLTENTVNLSGAWKKSGKNCTETLDEAKKEFTTENGYFAGSSACERQ